MEYVKKFVKNIDSITVFDEKEDKVNNYFYKFYCKAGEKYKIWHFFPFPHYRTLITEEDMFVGDELYPKSHFNWKSTYHDDEKKFYVLPSVEIKRFDGTFDYRYFKTLEEAIKYAEMLSNDFGLKEIYIK